MSVPPFTIRPAAPRLDGPTGPVAVAPGVHWVGALDPGLRNFDVILKTANGTTYNAYAVRGSDGVAVIDTVKAEFAGEFFARLEAVARYDEIRLIVLNHLEPDHTGAVPELLRRAPQAQVRLSPRGLPMLRALLKDEFALYDIKGVTTGQSVSLGDRDLQFFTTPFVHWPDTQCTWLAAERVLFTCDLFGSHYCDGRLFNDLVGDFRFSFEYYFDRIMRPFRSFVAQALDLIEPLDFGIIAPAHGPILRSHPRDYLTHTRRLISSRLASETGSEKTLLIFYVSAYGATAQLAQAIHDGAAESPDVRVSLFDLEGGEIAPFLDLIEEADGIALGTPTINGDAVRTIWEMLAALVDIETRGKLGAAFGSYGWSGEAVRLVETRLQGLKMRLPEPGLRVKLHPSAAELDEGRAFGRRLADHLTGRAAPREVDFAEIAAR
ncbi:FprA family A-type flavoprotein [Rhodobacter capsulatus]|uniref:Flavorubredoxin n=1 Tax=Rhodobacter capsulatus TaxID=1061 RepID=A0A1G7NNH4_RHOCA|nr:FprA family A-type flavoprotein [Rhodobacter capsulatus]WER09111.1 FprA family A-type flavoprotein [Rhodobacter capsulatus]SDF75614.1 Flavorubredoxin [Rhodobacter capsulatus]